MRNLATAPRGLRGSLTLPGDKSISHRALMIGAMANGTTTIDHFLTGNDCLATLTALRQLGVEIELNGTQVTIQGRPLKDWHPATEPLQMENSGTTTRLMMGLLAGTNFSTTLIGDESLQQRPMRRVSEPLKQFGVQVATSDAGTLPVTVTGGVVQATNYNMTVASAQVKSALILAALQADGVSTIKEVLPTRNHTEIMLKQFGAQLETLADGVTIKVHPHPQLTGQHVVVPGDMSSAAFFMVAASIVPNSEITLKQVNLNPTRTGILTQLQAMGAKITVTQLPSDGEPVGDITIQTSQLHGIEIGATDIPALIDELPILALAAATANGKTVIRGAAELRVKETDRIKTVATELRKLGVQVVEYPDGMDIWGQPTWQVTDTTLNSYHDHRVGMMAAIAALRSDVAMQLRDDEAVAVSYPEFFTDLEGLIQ